MTGTKLQKAIAKGEISASSSSDLLKKQKEQIKAFNSQGEKYKEIYKKHRDLFRAEMDERRKQEVLLKYAAYEIMLEELRNA